MSEDRVCQPAIAARRQSWPCYFCEYGPCLRSCVPAVTSAPVSERVSATDVCVWVLAHDGGCEGYSGPVQAFATKLEALAGQALSKAAGNTLALFLVPMWPNVADVAWSAVNPWEAGDDQPFSIDALARKALGA